MIREFTLADEYHRKAFGNAVEKAALKIPCITSTNLHVLNLLIRKLDWPESVAIASKAELAEQMRSNERTVQRSLQFLKKSGVLSVHANAVGGRGNYPAYRLHVVEGEVETIMRQKGFDELTVGILKSLVADRVEESLRLKFKHEIYGGKDRDNAEAAADLSAMANGVGGTLIIGIADENGCASELVGVKSSDPESLLRTIQNSLRSGIEPTLCGVQIKWVPIDDQRGAIVIYVPRSWYGPHRVNLNKDQNFYIRDENGKHPMSIMELRRAFVADWTV